MSTSAGTARAASSSERASPAFVRVASSESPSALINPSTARGSPRLTQCLGGTGPDARYGVSKSADKPVHGTGVPDLPE